MWVLREGRPEPVAVHTGVSDGTSTQLLDDGLAPGTELVVDALSTTGRP